MTLAAGPSTVWSGTGATGPGSTTSTTLVEHTPPPPRIGAATDSSDFFGIFIGLGVIILAVIIIKVAFPSRRR